MREATVPCPARRRRPALPQAVRSIASRFQVCVRLSFDHSAPRLAMPHFFSGDELGAIKSISYAPGETRNEWKPTTTVLVPGSPSGRSKTVQKLAVHSAGSDTLVLALAPSPVLAGL